MNDSVFINQSIAILVDGNNIQISLHNRYRTPFAMVNFDVLIPRLVGDRSLKHLVYFREGRNISKKFEKRLRERFYGRVMACGKNADIPLTIQAVQMADKVDTVIICSGDSDYLSLVDFLHSRGIRVEICGVRESMSNDLLEAADQYYFVDTEDVFFYDKNLAMTNFQQQGQGNYGYGEPGDNPPYGQAPVWDEENPM